LPTADVTGAGKRPGRMTAAAGIGAGDPSFAVKASGKRPGPVPGTCRRQEAAESRGEACRPGCRLPAEALPCRREAAKSFFPADAPEPRDHGLRAAAAPRPLPPVARPVQEPPPQGLPGPPEARQGGRNDGRRPCGSAPCHASGGAPRPPPEADTKKPPWPQGGMARARKGPEGRTYGTSTVARRPGPVNPPNLRPARPSARAKDLAFPACGG
jgi:hypothetical protein